MMKHVLAVSCFFVCALAGAQTPPVYLGTWKVTWQGERRLQEAVLKVSESGGTWKAATSSRNDPCVGREAPISFEEINGDEATLRLKFSEALRGCADTTIKLKKLSDKAMTGTREAVEMTFTRE